MVSKFSLQKPYVVASLPQPINTNGRYVVGQVYGGVPGSKKRKRSELAVGIDGEGVNLYDVSSTRLITSYSLPPQSSFTCPPSSLRSRASKSQIERRTYVSITGPEAQLKLFKESEEAPATAVSTTISNSVQQSQSQIVFLGMIAAVRGSGRNTLDLLAVKKDGEIQCYDGDSLKEKWTSPSTALGRSLSTSMDDVEVEFTHITNAHAASQGILKGRKDVLALYSQEITEDGFNPELIVVITKSPGSTSMRTLHLVGLPRRSMSISNSLRNPIEPLISVDLPSKDMSTQVGKTSFSVQVSTGILYQLTERYLYSFDLSDTLPREQYKLKTAGAKSFLRLSSTSIIVSHVDNIVAYNPKYQSILATVDLESTSNTDSLKRKRKSEDSNDIASKYLNFATYFPKLGLATAISESNLIAIQVEGHQDRQGRPHTAGLLIDSLGCSVRERTRPDHGGRGKRDTKMGLKTVATYLPGSIGEAETPWPDQIAPIESAFSSGDLTQFDALLLAKLENETSNETEKLNGITPIPNATISSTLNSQALRVDRRWILFALGKIFTTADLDREGTPRLSILFYPPSVFMWLVQSGYLTITNIETALRRSRCSAQSFQSGDLVNALIEVDPDMDLLLALIAKNFLEAPELLHALRRLMESLGLFGEDAATKHTSLTNGDDEVLENGDVDAEVEKLEADLALAEYQLGPGSGVRGRALSLALSKLYTCPTNTIVYGLQTTYTAPEIVSVVYLLRFELARGAWTSRYLDDTTEIPDVIDEEAEISGNAITLVSSLLNNCIDAIGAGGWLFGDARLINGDAFEAEDLISSLKLEVSAALEGIEEAEYLKGMTSEMVRYGDAVQKATPLRVQGDASGISGPKKHKTLVLPSGDEERTLPLGLKSEQQVSKFKVGAGGEVYARSMRDIGHLKSQKVRKYTRERIVV